MKRKKSYFTYIVTCADGTLYSGKTTDLLKRLRQHNGEIKGGAKYTQGRRPVLLHYWEEHPSHSIAIQRELALKKLSRKEKIHLTAGENLPI